MDFKLIWTESAIDDLSAIVRYVTSKSSSEVAHKIGFEIYDKAQILMRFPQLGSILPEKSNPNWRRLIVRSWKIVYKIDTDKKVVYVVRIWHGSRDEIEIK